MAKAVSPFPAPANRQPDERLGSWKEIAAYLKCGVTTVQRWEKQEGMPVHRHVHRKLGTVYAYKAELDTWWEERRGRLEAEQRAEPAEIPAPATAGAPSAEASRGDGARRRTPPAWRRPLTVAGLGLALAASLAVIWLFRADLGKRLPGIFIGRAEPARASSAPQPARAQAEALYLQGRYYWHKRTAPDLNRAVDYFTQSIVHDPSYAPAYVGLADCYNLLREYGTMPDSEAFPRALAAAKKAVELDDSSSDAHASLAFASFYGAWDTATADREFNRAIELNPSNVRAHHWHATFLMTVGRSQEAIAQINRAQELDPGSKAILADKGLILFYAGRADEAVALLRRMERDDPSFMSPHRYLAFIDLANGDYPGYLIESRQMALLTKDEQELALVQAQEQGWARNGVNGMLGSILQQKKERFEKGSQPAYPLAQACAMLGHKQEALGYLQIAYRQHEVNLLTIRIDPTLNGLHNEPAYRELVAQVFPNR
ncbi:MAG TPA: tetratricopeptide repeat protein [Terriglobia bacterium]|nr:tetratricopeptide repeat protein [Terriglobia bacterium]